MKTINKSVSAVFQLIKRMKEVEKKSTQRHAHWTIEDREHQCGEKNRNDCYSHSKLLSILSTPLNCHFVLLFAFGHGIWFSISAVYYSMDVPLFHPDSVCIVFLNWLNTWLHAAVSHSLSPCVYYLWCLWARKFGAEFTIDDHHFNHNETNKQNSTTEGRGKKRRPLMKKSSEWRKKGSEIKRTVQREQQQQHWFKVTTHHTRSLHIADRMI